MNGKPVCAIACYEAALRVSTEKDFPRDWATIQNNLGEAWAALPTDDEAENLRRATAHFRAALRVFTEQSLPQYWAMIQNNFGDVWAGMPSGDPRENHRRAAGFYEAALRVFTEQEFPREYAISSAGLRRMRQHLGEADFLS